MTSAAHDLRRFTAEEYLQMISAGIIKHDDRVNFGSGGLSGLRHSVRELADATGVRRRPWAKLVELQA